MTTKGFFHSLRFKITMGLLLPLVVVLACTFYLRYISYRRVLMENLELGAASTGETIEGSLLYAMLTNDSSAVQQILDNIVERQGVLNLFLLDK